MAGVGIFRPSPERRKFVTGYCRAHSRNTPFLADLHIAFGIAIFLLALVRVFVRLRRGVPPPPRDEHILLRLAARAVHLALYAIILLMPVTGGMAWFGGIETMAAVHGAGKPVILGLVALHIGGALYQHFVARTDVLRRMLRPER